MTLKQTKKQKQKQNKQLLIKPAMNNRRILIYLYLILGIQ